jgi:hypothetical protein
MRTQGFGFIAVGRFMAVERYCQSHQPSSTHPLQASSVDRTGGPADKPGQRNDLPAPAQSRRR